MNLGPGMMQNLLRTSLPVQVELNLEPKPKPKCKKVTVSRPSAQPSTKQWKNEPQMKLKA